jgi:dynein heavy chain
LQKEVHVARKEANENCKYLQTLEVLFKTLVDPTKDLSEVADLFVPIMHTILMIWTYSEFYNTPARLVVLIREICNAIITACHGYINGEGLKEYISAESPQDAHVKLEKCIDVCAKFKEAYFDYKSKSKNQWKITTNALFVRLDAFSERC